MLKFEGEPGGGIRAAKSLAGEADWCIRLRVMPLEGGEKGQTLLCMAQIELRYDALNEKLSLIAYPNASGLLGGTVTVSLLRDQWSEVVASLKGKELTLRVGEQTAIFEIPESGLFDNFKLPFRVGSRGGEGGRPFTGMVSDISFGEPE